MRLTRDFLIALIRGAGWRIAVAVGLGALSALAEGMGLALLAPLLAAAGMIERQVDGAFGTLLMPLGLEGLLGLWLAVVGVQTVVSAGRDLVAFRVQEDLVGRLRLDLHQALMAVEWVEFQRLRGSDLVTTLTATISRIGLGCTSLIRFGTTMLVIMAQVAVAIATAPAAAAAALAVGLVLAVTQRGRLRRAFTRGRRMQRGSLDLNAVVSDHMAGMKLARAHEANPAFAASFAARLSLLRHYALAGARERIGGQVVFRVATALALVAGAWLALRVFELDGPSALVLLAVSSRLLPAIRQVLDAGRIGSEMLPSWVELTVLRGRLDAAIGPPAEVSHTPAPSGTLVFEEVGFCWPGRDKPAVECITLTIAENRTTALVGPSGAGKSTLADLAMGLLIPARGRITVGGMPLDGAARAAWRQRAAYVPQDGFLLHDSVRANLTLVASEAAEEDLWQALDMAAAAELVRGLPQGLDTVVGDRGVRLSGGERQRLTLARALLRKPAFLVLDEATSHLDRGHEQIIQQALNRLQGRLTVLVIAHRLVTIRDADHIAVIETGRVRESGLWENLGVLHGVE